MGISTRVTAVILAVAASLVDSAPTTPCFPLAHAQGVCVPYCSQGDVMHHTPSVNDTTATLLWFEAGGRGVDSAWLYDHGGYGRAQWYAT
jgi:hypothetical protein